MYEQEGNKKMDLLPLALILTGIVLIILATASHQKKLDERKIDSIEDRLNSLSSNQQDIFSKIQTLSHVRSNILELKDPVQVEIVNKNNLDMLAPKPDKKLVKKIKKQINSLSK